MMRVSDCGLAGLKPDSVRQRPGHYYHDKRARMHSETRATSQQPATPIPTASSKLLRTWPWWLALAGAFAAGTFVDTTLLRTWLGRDSAPASAAKSRDARAQPVSVGVVRRQDMRTVLSAIGTIAPSSTTVVRSRIDGELKELHFKEGQPVTAGQLLAEIDPRPFQIALAQAQGTLARDRAALNNARRDAARFRDLLAKDGIARQQVEQQEALVEQLEGTVQADQAQVDNATLQLSYTRIVAPIPGVAGLKQVDPGNLVRANDANGLLTINQMQPVNVVFAVPEVHLPRIRQRMARRDPLKVEVWDRDQKTQLAAGQLSTLDNAIDTVTGTIKLKASFDNADGRLYANQFVNVRLQLDTALDALAVPTTALMRSAQGGYVFLVNSDNSVNIRSVQAGEADGDWTSVSAELAPGDRVVTDGTDRLRDGSKVQVIERQAARNPASLPAVPDLPPVQKPAQRPAATPEKAVPKTRPPVASAPAASAEKRPAWVEALPPEDAAKVMKLDPEQRQAWLRKNLEERARTEAEAMVGPNPPEWTKRLPPEAMERLKNLSLEQRQAWLFKKMLERTQQ
ncbi:efflux RND transporter periplasmic adaptor subunit [Herbaspirillum sp. HC18]|nr:efflux RND transporter periplasmic adaptor subunit [Herbaspirillum sp. HC18]